MKIMCLFYFQKINEQSLKLLHSNVQSIENGLSVAELSLTFFKKRPGVFFSYCLLCLEKERHFLMIV